MERWKEGLKLAWLNDKAASKLFHPTLTHNWLMRGEEKEDWEACRCSSSLSTYFSSWSCRADASSETACICGLQYEVRDPLLWRRCISCGKWQHAICHLHANTPSRYEEMDSTSDAGQGMDIDASSFQCILCEGRACLRSLVRGSGTLVVCTNTIRDQWKMEIDMHTRPRLPVLMYDGLHETQKVLTEKVEKVQRLLLQWSKNQRRLAKLKRRRETLADQGGEVMDAGGIGQKEDQEGDVDMNGESAERSKVVTDEVGTNGSGSSHAGAPKMTQREQELKVKSREMRRSVVEASAAVLECCRVFSPTELGRWPVVLTTFDVLNDELAFSSEQWDEDMINGSLAAESEGGQKKGLLKEVESGFKSDLSQESVLQYMRTSGSTKLLRREKRHRVLHTPLQRILWWRLAVDEAQNVDVSTRKVSIMASRLPARYRWCISGEVLVV